MQDQPRKRQFNRGQGTGSKEQTAKRQALAPGGSGGGDHGINHPSHNDWLAQHVALLDDVLLDQGHFLRQDIQPQVPSAQHDSIGFLRYGFEVEEGLPGLTLGNQLQSSQSGKSSLNQSVRSTRLLL